MKKIILLLSTALIFSCNKSEDLPKPIQTVNTVITTQSINPEFIGRWNCHVWLVDEITGATHRREFIFSEIANSTTNLSISLNDYTDSTSFNQMFTMSIAKIDSNFFDNDFNPIPVKFKGYLLTDTTMNVYQYQVDAFGIVDTVQTQLFIKE